MISRRSLLLTVGSVVLLTGPKAIADGFRPPKPYNYLNPPSALRKTNHPPTSGSRSAPLVNGRSSTGFVLFTGDTQAGVGAHPGAFVASLSARSVALTIRPTELPKSLPEGLLLDGNAYLFRAIAEPGRRPVSVRQQLGLVLRWPHPPLAIYMYAGSRWHAICDARSWQLSSDLVICHPSALGVFAAVHKSVSAPPKTVVRRKNP